jgi:hypothetical protein
LQTVAGPRCDGREQEQAQRKAQKGTRNENRSPCTPGGQNAARRSSPLNRLATRSAPRSDLRRDRRGNVQSRRQDGNQNRKSAQCPAMAPESPRGDGASCSNRLLVHSHQRSWTPKNCRTRRIDVDPFLEPVGRELGLKAALVANASHRSLPRKRCMPASQAYSSANRTASVERCPVESTLCVSGRRSAQLFGRSPGLAVGAAGATLGFGTLRASSARVSAALVSPARLAAAIKFG